MATAKDAYASVREMLNKAGITEPDAKARVIVAEALGIGLADMFVYGDVHKDDISRIEGMAQRCVV